MKRIILLLLTCALIFCGCGKAPEDAAGIVQEKPEFDVSTPGDFYRAAKDAGYTAFKNGSIEGGRDVFRRFRDDAAAGKTGKIYVIRYFEYDQYLYSTPMPPQEFVTELSFDGESYSYRTCLWDTDEADSFGTYKYMLHFEGETLVGDGIPMLYDEYVLANDDTVTWEQVEASLVTSSIFDHVDCYTVYRDWRRK